MEKVEPIFDYYHFIIAFKYLWRNYISLADAEKMRHYIRSKIEIPDKEDEIKLCFVGAGVPDFVNVDKSIEQGVYCFYSIDEINLTPTPMKELEP